MRKKQILIFSLALIFLMIFAVSCTARRPVDREPDNRTQQTRFSPRRAPITRSPLPVPRRQIAPGISPSPGIRTRNTGMGRDMTDRAERIADSVADLNDIESATCIISGDTAMIGVQFDEQFKGKLTNRIKKRVEDTVLRSDNKIDKVVVTADPDLVSRIKDIFEDIADGRPVSGFAREINELLNRIQPK